MIAATIVAVSTLAMASTPPADTLTARARIEGELKPGETARLIVEIESRKGWSLTQAGIPNAIIQIDAADCTELKGDRAKTQKALSRAGFLRHPEERFADGAKTEFEFDVKKTPGADDQFAINVLAYASPPDGANAWFIRRRIAIPIARGAVSRDISPTPSDWGVDDDLQLGDKAPLMKLPRADGSLVNLAEYLGKKNIVITTYRAHW
jgi:hypothetical protein